MESKMKLAMKCINISKDDGEHSLYINPNGLCNKCMMVKDKAVERKKRCSPWELWKIYGIDLKKGSK